MLETLSDKFHVSAAAAVLDGCDALYTIRANSHQPSTILVSTGTRLPAHVTAMGRVLLAHLEPGRLNEVLKQISFRSLTEKSVSNATQLRKLLAQVRQEGYSIVDEEMLFGSGDRRASLEQARRSGCLDQRLRQSPQSRNHLSQGIRAAGINRIRE